MHDPKFEEYQNFPSFSKSFSSLSDPRRTIKGNYQYPLNELLFLSISAVLSDAKSWGQIVLFGKSKLPWLQKYFSFEKGIPSADVLERLFARLDGEQFGKCFIDWVREKAYLCKEQVIAIDGKTARGSGMKSESLRPLHLVSAYATESRVTLGQVAVDQKSNEITAIPALLELLCLEGSIVTIDAMGCQKKIAEKIRAKKADYLLMVKGNQGSLLEEVKHIFTHNTIDSHSHENDFGHGRIEKRSCQVVTDLSFLSERPNWIDLSSVIRIERKVIHKSTLKGTNHVSYYISSSLKSAEEFNKNIRNHWAIENNLHWSLDVLFQEDKSLKKKGNSAQNFNIMTKIALNLIEKEPTPKISRIGKMKKCAYDDYFRDSVLNS